MSEPSGATREHDAAASRRRRALVAVAKLAVLAGFAALLVRFVDPEQIRLAIESISIGELAAYVALMLSVRLATAVRWLLVARSHLGLGNLSWPFLVRTELLAEFAQTGLQSFVGGEAVRVWKTSQRTQDPKVSALSVVVDRIVGLGALVVSAGPLAVFLVVTVAGSETLTTRSFSREAQLAVALAAALLVGSLVLWRFAPKIRDLIRRAVSVLRPSRALAFALLVGVFNFFLIALAHWVGFSELRETGWWVCATIAIVPRLGRAVPLSLVGVSAVEGGAIVVGQLFGVAPELMLPVAAANLVTKYTASGLGLLIELAVDGREFLRSAKTGALPTPVADATTPAP